LNIFIISWQGQHENAILISKQILRTNSKATIVYSDPDPKFVLSAPCESIRRSNELFWEDKFKTCLDSTGNNGMLVIHADCNCEDWGFLVKRCININQRVKNIGVWAPKIDGTFWNLKVSGIAKIEKFDLVISALTDGIVFYLSPKIIERMQQFKYGNNKFGWGIGNAFCVTSFVSNKLVVIDTAVNVFHPQKRGYDSLQAKKLKNTFINQFSLQERLQYELLRKYVLYNHENLSIEKSK
jgi:hypothetical protein